MVCLLSHQEYSQVSWQSYTRNKKNRSRRGINTKDTENNITFGLAAFSGTLSKLLREQYNNLFKTRTGITNITAEPLLLPVTISPSLSIADHVLLQMRENLIFFLPLRSDWARSIKVYLEWTFLQCHLTEAFTKLA